MKITKILYWVFTVLLIALMLFSAVSSFINSSGSAAFAKQFGYPVYIFKFLAIAKILGIVALVVPRYPRLKEWAYAGFTFDLIGALYSFHSNDAFHAADYAPILIAGLVFVSGSYIFYHKLKA